MSEPATEASRFQDGFRALREMPAGHGLLLGLFALFTALILAVSDELTRGPIADRAAEDLAASLSQVLPEELHDNEVTATSVVIEDAEEGTVTVYRATMDGAVTGVAFDLTGYGYGGAIRVLVGIDPEGTLLGARVLAHAETPGLGDKIEEAKDDWILGFSGRSLGNPEPARWAVQKDGGVFDQFSGATITPRAVVFTVRRGLEFFELHKDELLAEGAE